MKAEEALASIPTKIKAGPHTYAVAVVDQIEDAHAQIDTDALLIEISRKCPSASFVVGNLIHELLHDIWLAGGLGKRAEEERVVLAFERGLTQLFTDNPKLLTWIKRGLKK